MDIDREYRCPRCNRLVFMASGLEQSGHIYFICPRCKLLITLFNGEMVTAEPKAALPWRASPEHRQMRRRRLTPTPDEIVVIMQERWTNQWKAQSLKRAELAVGLRFKVFHRDGFRCRYCGKAAADGALLEADHVIPRSKGGLDSLENLVTACWECNAGKSDRLLTTCISI